MRPDGDWSAVRLAVLRRRGELGLNVETLAGRTGLSPTTVRYFGRTPANAGTLEAMGAGLGWPPGYLLRILNGESPRPAGVPVTPETPVMARLARIERKLDAVAAQLGGGQQERHADCPG